MAQLSLITVTGLKRSGKTTVVEAIVSELHARGHRVGTVKTMRHHPDELFVRATDTRRHAEAGAAVVVAVHEEGTSRFEKGRPPTSIAGLLPLFPADIRIVVSEGVIDRADPQLVVLCLGSAAALEETLTVRQLPISSVVAISGAGAAAWNQAELPGVRAFDVTDSAQKAALADMLLERMRLGSGSGAG
jgi:molybdopterin-guanine dinucleotide biosynthesis protein MobB